MALKDDKYIELSRKLHETNNSYGSANNVLLPEIVFFLKKLKPKHVIDYGCGKGLLLNILKNKFPKINFYGYDPAIPEYENLRINKADFVINSDVLEHIPEKDIDDVLFHISSLSKNVFFNLHHGKAEKLLPNGENAHITIKPSEWYHEKMAKYFNTIIPLPARTSIQSVVVTFKLSNKDVKHYNMLIKNSLEAKTKKKIPKFLIKFLCCFIVGKEKRIKFRKSFS
jgi:hypothetical protein